MSLTIRFISLTAVSAFCSANSTLAQLPAEGCRVPTGTYESVSESEWSITLKLKRGGHALVVLESWLAGEHGRRNVEKVRATWSCRGSDVALTYGDVSDDLRYEADLPFKEFGFQGAGPGLSSTGAVKPNSKLGGATLWKHPIKTGGPIAEGPSNYRIQAPAGGTAVLSSRNRRSPAAPDAERYAV